MKPLKPTPLAMKKNDSMYHQALKVRCNICDEAVTLHYGAQHDTACNCQNVRIETVGKQFRTIRSDNPSLAKIFDFDTRHWFALRKKTTSFY